jgi:hypothetical protein
MRVWIALQQKFTLAKLRISPEFAGIAITWKVYGPI